MAITIVSIYLLVEAFVLIAVCFAGAKKSGADKED